MASTGRVCPVYGESCFMDGACSHYPRTRSRRSGSKKKEKSGSGGMADPQNAGNTCPSYGSKCYQGGGNCSHTREFMLASLEEELKLSATPKKSRRGGRKKGLRELQTFALPMFDAYLEDEPPLPLSEFGESKKCIDGCPVGQGCMFEYGELASQPSFIVSQEEAKCISLDKITIEFSTADGKSELSMNDLQEDTLRQITETFVSRFTSEQIAGMQAISYIKAFLTKYPGTIPGCHDRWLKSLILAAPGVERPSKDHFLGVVCGIDPIYESGEPKGWGIPKYDKQFWMTWPTVQDVRSMFLTYRVFSFGIPGERHHHD